MAGHYTERGGFINNPNMTEWTGALMADYHRRICMMKYNYLTLPQAVQFRRGDRIEYVYNAAGVSLTGEGYIEKATGSSTYTAHYYLKDRLGNHRVVIDAAGTVKQVSNYLLTTLITKKMLIRKNTLMSNPKDSI
jgi:hypothetical protein